MTKSKNIILSVEATRILNTLEANAEISSELLSSFNEKGNSILTNGNGIYYIDTNTKLPFYIMCNEAYADTQSLRKAYLALDFDFEFLMDELTKGARKDLKAGKNINANIRRDGIVINLQGVMDNLSVSVDTIFIACLK